jgi:lysophospholipase L1-like esterase
MSLFFTNRGTSLGVVNVNDVGNTENDYNKAIEKVCKIMGVPFIDIYNIGFTRQNMYPTFAQDDETNPTHPNSIGQTVLAKKIVDNIGPLVKQFFGPYVPK